MSDDVLVVTGGGSGIGRSVALLAAKRGTSVAVLARTAEAVSSVAREAEAMGAPRAAGIVCDVTSPASIATAFEQVDRLLGPLNGLFANAGIELSGFAHELPLETWDSVIATNLTGTFSDMPRRVTEPAALRAHRLACPLLVSCELRRLCRGCGKLLQRIQGGHILPRTQPRSRLCKVSHSSQCRRPRSHGYRNDVDRAFGGRKGLRREELSREIPLGRLADPDEPAEAVLWLLSEQSRYVTGSHLICDGGILAKASISV